VDTSDQAEQVERWLQALHAEEEHPVEREAFVVALRGENYWAFPLAFTRHIARLTTFTPLPDAIPLLPGLTNWEGRVLPLIDLAPLVHQPPLSLEGRTYMVIVGHGDLEGGILVSRAVDIQEVPKGHIQTDEISSYILGTYTWPLEDATYVVHIVDVDRVLTAAREAYG